MPGRVMVGLSPYEKQPGQFGPPGLLDEPHVTLGRVLAGGLIGLLVLVVIHGVRIGLIRSCVPRPQELCPPPPGSGIPFGVWLSLAVLLAGIVIAWPYCSYVVKRWQGGV